MQTSYDKENVIYAGFFSRLAAYVLDSILVSIGLCIVKLPVWFVKLAVGDSALFRPVLFEYTIFDILYYLLTVAYFVLMTYYCGATVGKYLMKLRVVDVEGRKLSFMSVLLRETVGRYLSALIIYIGYIIVGVDNRKQGLHDKIADTCVIYRHRAWEKPVEPMPSVQPVQQTENFPQEAVFSQENGVKQEADLSQKDDGKQEVDMIQRDDWKPDVDMSQRDDWKQEADLKQSHEYN